MISVKKTILIKALRSTGVCPPRHFSNIEEFKNLMEHEENIFIDGTVREHFRPRDYEQQKEYYDGKKKAYGKKYRNN